MILAGVIARSIIEPKFINFDEPELVGQSLLLLGSLTSLIAGLFIALQLHFYVNNFIIEIAGKYNLINYSHYKMKASRKKDFFSTLDEFYGNFLISIILFFMFLSYFLDFIWLDSIQLLWSFKPPLIKSDVTLTIFLFLFLLFMVFNAIKSYNALKKRLNFFVYFEYYQYNRELFTSVKKEDFKEQLDWLNEYRKQFSSNWDRAEELYNNQQFDLLLVLQQAIKISEYFPKEYRKRCTAKNIRKYAEVESSNMSSIGIFDPLNRLWNFWKSPPRSFGDIYSTLYTLKLKGIMSMINQNRASILLGFYDKVEEIDKLRSEMVRKMDRLAENKYDFGLKGEEKNWLSDDLERGFKELLFIEQFSEYKDFIEDYFQFHKKEKEVYEEKFKPLAQNASRKFQTLEEKEYLLDVLQEAVTLRNNYLESIKTFSENTSINLKILNECLTEFMPRERNRIIQFFSRL